MPPNPHGRQALEYYRFLTIWANPDTVPCYTFRPPDRTRIITVTSRATSEWLPQVLIESVLIVVSILVALGLDSWREERQDAEVVRQALSNFLVEIDQNKLRVDDAAPFNEGLYRVVTSYYIEDQIDSVAQFVDMMQSYSPTSLQSTAWDTALATGSLAKMDYNLVTALSLTYSLQSRYQLATQSGMYDLTSPFNLTDDGLEVAVYNSIRYLDDVTGMEQELSVTYAEATRIIDTALRLMRGETGEE